MKIWQIKKGQGLTFSNKGNLSSFMISQSLISQIRDCFVDFPQICDFTCLKLMQLLYNELDVLNEERSKKHEK